MRSTAEPGVGTHPKPLRRIEAALSQLGCVAANEDAQANVFPLLPARIVGALLAPVHVPPLRGFGGGGMPCPRFRFASPGVTHGATPPALDASDAIA